MTKQYSTTALLTLGALTLLDVAPKTQPGSQTGPLAPAMAATIAQVPRLATAKVTAIAAPETSRPTRLGDTSDPAQPIVVGSTPLSAPQSPTRSTPTPTATTPTLTDVTGHWAEPMISTLLKAGIIHGFKDGSFRPDAPVSLANWQDMMQQVIAKQGQDFLKGEGQTRLRPEMLPRLTDLEVINGSERTATPQRQTSQATQPVTKSPSDKIVTRAQAVAVLYQALAKAGAVPGLTAGKTLRPTETPAAKANQPLWPETTAPLTVTDLIKRCKTLNQMGRYTEVLVLCERAPEADAAIVAALANQQSTALAGLGRLSAALAAADRAVTLNAGVASAWSNRAVILWRLNQPTAALASIENALSLQPNYATAWFNKGRILSTLKQDAAAMAAYDRALQGDQSATDPAAQSAVWVNRSAVLWRLGKHSEALTAADRAVKIDPQSAVNWINQGSVWMALNQPKAAAKAYQKATQLSPRNAYAWTGQGIALTQLGQPKIALAALNQALALDPQQTLAQTTQAAVLKQLPRSAMTAQTPLLAPPSQPSKNRETSPDPTHQLSWGEKVLEAELTHLKARFPDTDREPI